MMIELPQRCFIGRVNPRWFARMRPLYLNYTGSETLTDYQVRCTLTPSDIPFEKLRDDKRDLLFVDRNNEMIPYWIEKADNTEIIVWLKLPEITPGKGVLWLYYGNGNFRGASDGSKVFEFFDCFTGTSLDTSKWSTHGNSSKITVNNELILEKISDDAVAVSGDIGNITGAAFDLKYHQEDDGYAASVSIGSGNILQSSGNDKIGNNGWFVDDGYYAAFWDYDFGSYYKWKIGKAEAGSLEEDLDEADHADGADLSYHSFSLRIANGQISLYRDGSLILSASDSSFSTFTKIVLSNAGGGFYQSRAHYDDVRVRKYTEAEPFIEV